MRYIGLDGLDIMSGRHIVIKGCKDVAIGADTGVVIIEDSEIARIYGDVTAIVIARCKIGAIEGDVSIQELRDSRIGRIIGNARIGVINNCTIDSIADTAKYTCAVGAKIGGRNV